jgi:hypothetical protein
LDIDNCPVDIFVFDGDDTTVVGGGGGSVGFGFGSSNL